MLSSLTGLAALDLSSRAGKPTFTEAWRNRAMAVHFSCPVVYDGHLYGCHGQRRLELRAIDVTDGRVRWSEPVPGIQRAGIVRAGACLLIYTDAGRLVVVDADPRAFRQRAAYDLAGSNWSPPVVAAGCLFLRDRQSLRCVELPGTGPAAGAPTR